ncbi:MAG: GNAT family N-acetyltransferase [Halapricum sp.]
MVHVREATTEELDTVITILDAAILETDRDVVRRSVRTELTLVALEDGRVLGAVVALPADRGVRIDGIAVRKRRQGNRLGSMLVETLLDRHGRVVAAFDDRVRPFYESLGFDVTNVAPGRYRGVWD